MHGFANQLQVDVCWSQCLHFASLALYTKIFLNIKKYEHFEGLKLPLQDHNLPDIVSKSCGNSSENPQNNLIKEKQNEQSH